MPDEHIIVRREAEEEHDGHHGGGWKVAYADFMTAMMAFFLLLWILSSADEDQLVGLAKYFSPVLLNSTGSGPGVLDGQVAEDEATDQDDGRPPVGVEETTLPSFGQAEPLAVFDSRLRHETQPNVVVEYVEIRGSSAAEVQQAEPDPAKAEEGEGALERAREKLESGLAAAANGETLSEHVRIARTEEGLEVQIVDLETGAMFERGSSRIEAETRDLIAIIGDAIAGLPNRVIIAGHTDAVPFSESGVSDNWELSTARAHATRRELVAQGISAVRIARVSGFADTRPLLPDAPKAPENRRVSVLLVEG